MVQRLVLLKDACSAGTSAANYGKAFQGLGVRM
jgi:hypothetical protein